MPRSAPARPKPLLRPAARASRMPNPPKKQPKIALAMAGGGPLGAIYEIGALAALSDALDGLELTQLHTYVGVSAGSILCAGLANGIMPHKMCEMFIEDDRSEEPFDPAMLLQPAFREYWQRLKQVPPLVANAAWHYLTNPRSQGFFDSFQRLSRAIPTGVFSNAGLNAFLSDAFTRKSRTNDFRKLHTKLILVATDLDSGASVEFGQPGFDHVPISVAAQASSALPGLFPPVQIDGRFYLDGALKKTLHAGVALKEGADLVLCLNPLVPFDDSLATVEAGDPKKLVEGGLPVVLSQTFRALIHSRMQVGMRQYDAQYRDADVVLFEPNKSDAEVFFTNVFSYASRGRLCEHAYQKTRAELWLRRHELQPILAKHGITLNLGVLKDPALTLVRKERRYRPKRAPLPLTHVSAALGDCLDDLDRFVQYTNAKNKRLTA
jgi:NTE family protein